VNPPGDPPPVNPPPTSGFVFGTPGPWAVANVEYGAAAGLRESPVVGVTTDEAQNRWIATHGALYLLRPGQNVARRYDERDGLHLGAAKGVPQGGDGWARYCNGRPIERGARCGGTEGWGSAAAPGILSIAGGAADEVFVGYAGAFTHPEPVCNPANPDEGSDHCDPLRHSGKIDRVKVRPDGTLEVTRFDLVANAHGAKYWHDRTVLRLVYDHHVNPHTLYAGTNHGVTILFPDRWRPPRDGEWFDLAYQEWMGDHLHARVCFERVCTDASGQRMGDWRGLAIDGRGSLWHAGRWTAGLISYDPDPLRWFSRNGAAFEAAFGDPYLGPRSSGFDNEPVFKVAASGHSVFLTGVAVCPDGRVWFSSSGVSDGIAETVAVWDGRAFRTFRAEALGLGEAAVRDVACLPDGRLVLAGFTTGLAVHDPATGVTARVRAGGGIPSDRVLALEVDRMADPPSLHVATSAGAAVLRVLP
jgi:hypothetical protein